MLAAASVVSLASAAGPALARAAARPDVAGVISAIAGGVGGPGPATSIGLVSPCGMTFANGSLQIADGSTVRTVDPGTGRLTTPAGDGALAPLGDGGPAAQASLNVACGVAVDHFGNLVIVDGDNSHSVPSGSANDRVRVAAHSTGTFYGQAMTAGDIYTVAGNGTRGHAGIGGPATAAELNNPQAVAVDQHGNLVIADQGNNRIVVVAAVTGTFYGQAMTAGDIYRVAGTGASGFTGDGIQATRSELSLPADVAVDSTGNLLIADTFNDRVRVVAVKTGTFYGQAMTAGDIYTIAGNGLSGHTGDGGPATRARLRQPERVTVDAAGNAAISDPLNRRVRVVAESTGTFYGRSMTAGDIYTIAGNGLLDTSGNGLLATSAEFEPTGVAADHAGNALIASSRRDGRLGGNKILVRAASSGTFYGRSMTAGHLYDIVGTGKFGFSGDGGPAAGARLDLPGAVTVDAAGNVLISDSGNERVRVVAVKAGTFYGQAMTAGDIYTIAGNGTRGFAGDGGPATAAELNFPSGLATDGAGNVLIADPLNCRVRVVAERTGTFFGRSLTSGDIYTLAGTSTCAFSGDGGPATGARLNEAFGVAADSAGNAVIADTLNDRVRVVAGKTGTFYGQAMTAGDIYTVAGNGSSSDSGDGGPATAAGVSGPAGLAVDSVGNLLIGNDLIGSDRVRVVAVSTGTFYGQAMTAGDIYTIVGNGTFGFSGDGGPATAAEIGAVPSLAIDGAGNLLIADEFNGRVRMVSG